MTINFNNPLAMLIMFIVISALVLIVIVYFLYKAYEKLLPKLYAKTSKQIFALTPLVLAVPFWHFVCYQIYKTFFDIQLYTSVSICIGVAVGLAATSMYEIAIQKIIKYLENVLKEKGLAE